MHQYTLRTIAMSFCIIAFFATSDVFAQRKTGAVQSIEMRRVVRLDNQAMTTAISGTSGSRVTTLNGPRNYVLQAIEFSERGDNPCYIKAFFVTARHGYGTEQYTTEESDSCSASNNDKKVVSTGNSNAPLEAIHAIQVGHNKAGDKVKAVRINGSSIDQDGSGDVRQDAGMTDSFERPNFKEPWKNRVSCPVGQVAVGLVLHHTGFNDDSRLEGIALKCASATVHEYAYKPGTNDRVKKVNVGG